MKTAHVKEFSLRQCPCVVEFIFVPLPRMDFCILPSRGKQKKPLTILSNSRTDLRPALRDVMNLMTHVTAFRGGLKHKLIEAPDCVA